MKLPIPTAYPWNSLYLLDTQKLPIPTAYPWNSLAIIHPPHTSFTVWPLHISFQIDKFVQVVSFIFASTVSSNWETRVNERILDAVHHVSGTVGYNCLPWQRVKCRFHVLGIVHLYRERNLRSDGNSVLSFESACLFRAHCWSHSIPLALGLAFCLHLGAAVLGLWVTPTLDNCPLWFFA